MQQFSETEKAVIENDYLEKGWCPHTIWAQHPSKGWDRTSVWRLVKKIEETGSTGRRKGSGRPVTVATEIVEELAQSQEDKPGTHITPRKIEEKTGINRRSVQRMLSMQKLANFKRMKEPRRDKGQMRRRKDRAGGLAKRFEKNKTCHR